MIIRVGLYFCRANVSPAFFLLSVLGCSREHSYDQKLESLHLFELLRVIEAPGNVEKLRYSSQERSAPRYTFRALCSSSRPPHKIHSKQVLIPIIQYCALVIGELAHQLQKSRQALRACNRCYCSGKKEAIPSTETRKAHIFCASWCTWGHGCWHRVNIDRLFFLSTSAKR